MKRLITHRKRWGFDNVIVIIDQTRAVVPTEPEWYSAGIYPWPWPREYLQDADLVRSWLHDPRRKELGRTAFWDTRKGAFKEAEKLIGGRFNIVRKMYFH